MIPRSLTSSTLLWTLTTLLGIGPSSVAQISIPTPTPIKIPGELQRLLQGPQQPASITANTPSQQGLTLPSLWWVDDQFGAKTVIDWQAYPAANLQDQQVHVYIRSNLWSRFNYLERYAFVTHFGNVTRTYGYQLVMLDRNGYPLSSYLCDFTQLAPSGIAGVRDAQQQPVKAYSMLQTSELSCEMWLNPVYPRNVF